MSKIILITTILILSIFAGCSQGKSQPISPSNDHLAVIPINTSTGNNSDRILMGSYRIDFDLNTMTALLSPDRSNMGHFEISSQVPLEIDLKSTDPYTSIWTIDLTLTNTFPITGYDPRLIFYTDNSGYRLQNPDDWTSQWDIAGGMIINPFIAFSSDDPDREFTAQTAFTETAQVYLPILTPVNMALDVSYPGNCEDPVSIEVSQHGQLYDISGPTLTIIADVDDHQKNVDNVSLYCPVITGDTLVDFTEISSGTWETEITNANSAGNGHYYGVVIASSGPNKLYDIFNLTVENSGFSVDFDFVNSWGDLGTDICESVVYDEYQNIYAGGTFSGLVDFGDGNPINAEDSNFACLVKYYADGSFAWVRAWGSAEIFKNSDVLAVTILNGSIFACGSFQGTVDFGDGPVTALEMDCFVCKFSPDGELMWVNTFGGDSFEIPYSITSDGIDGIFVGGEFSGTVDFGDGPVTTNGFTDGFILKYTATGDFDWVYTYGGTLLNTCNSVAYKDDKIFSCGTHSNDADFGDGSPVAVNGDMDMFFLTLNSDSTFNNVETWGGTSDETASSIMVDSSGNSYIGGYFKGTVDFGDGIRASNGYKDCFIVKFDSTDNFEWARTWGGTGDEEVSDMVFASNGFIYTVGYFEGTVDFNDGFIEECPGDFSAYLCKLTPSNLLVGINTIGGPGNGYATSNTIDTSIDGRICMGGYHRFGVDFGDGNIFEAYGDGFIVSWFDLN